MFRRVLFIGLVVCLFVGGASAFLSGYGYYQDATVNNTGSNLTNYQVMFVVNTSSGTSSGTTLYLNSHSEADLDDLRFTSTSDTVYDYWIESTSNPYTVWVEVPSLIAGNTTLRVQYGNAGASVVSNGTTTFPFFDHFTGTFSDLWNGAATVSGSEAVITGVPGQCYSKTTWGTGYILRGRVKDSLWSTSNAGFGFWDGSAAQYTLFYGAYPTAAKINYLSKVSSATSTTDNNPGTGYFVFELSRNGSTNMIYKIDGVTKATKSDQVTTNNIAIFMAAAGSTFTADWVLIRNLTTTEPTVPAWSAEAPTTSAPVAAFSANRCLRTNPRCPGKPGC